eukprot:s209_g3.t1
MQQRSEGQSLFDSIICNAAPHAVDGTRVTLQTASYGKLLKRILADEISQHLGGHCGLTGITCLAFSIQEGSIRMAQTLFSYLHLKSFVPEFFRQSMKLSGSHMLSLLLVAACVSCNAFKLQGASSDGTFSASMQSAANVAELAYQQQKISTNTWKTLSNVSCFLEAARSAGLAWTESDAQNHIVLTAKGLKSELLELDAHSASGLRVRVGKGKKKSYPGLLDADDKADFQEEAIMATAQLVTSWILTGKPPSFQDFLSMGVGLGVTVLTMVNPVLGAVAGMTFSLISGLLWPPNPNETPEAKLYKQIMEDVGIAIEQSQAQEAIGNARADLEAVMDELQWMPQMLGGVVQEGIEPTEETTEEQRKLLLTYNIMIQHDIAKMSYKIQNSAFGQAEARAATNEWAAAMFPLAEQLMLLQTNLLTTIASHDAVQNADAASDRILDLWSDWKKWIDANIHKVHLASAPATVKFLNWHVGDRREYSGGIKGTWKKGACKTSGIDACKKMNCIEKDYSCGKFDHPLDHLFALGSPNAWCGGACYKWTALDFYWQ